MQRLIANFSGRAQRRTDESGRSWLVAPVSMIVPGVLSGSKGPLHYPPNVVAQNAGRWGGIPLTLGHPSDVVTNAPLSASDRGVVDRLGLGVVRNDRFEGGKHRAEAWFDEEKTKRLAPNVYNALVEGRTMEVSTGLFTQEVERGGTYNGRSYTHEVMGYTPDHLAILPDQTGACSVRDGCGLNVHNAAMVQNDKTTGRVILPNGAHIQLKDGSVCPCGGVCKSCVTTNAMGMPAIPHPEPNDNSAGSSPATPPPVSTPRTDVGMASPSPPAATSSGLGPKISQPPSPATPPPSAREGVGIATPPSVTNGDDEMCPCGGECKICREKTENANPEQNNAAVDKLRGAQLKEQYEKVFPGMKEWLKRNVRDRLGSAMRTNNEAACSCGGTCNECKSKMVENDCPAAGEEKGENADSTPEPQPRCPIKQTFQPRGFKGKGRGEAHTAAKQGMADTGDPTTNSLNDDRSSAGHSNNGGSVMDRKQMIQHLTTNCDCYKGKAGVVLNSMTDEQLSDLITNAQAIAEIRGLNSQFAGLTTNAIPAALKAAMDKKAGEKAGDTIDDAEPDDDEDDEEVVPVPKGKAPPTGNSARTTEQWLRTAPADVQRLVRNSLARERKEKEQLIDVLVANVSNGPAKAALVANYLKMDVELLKAQVDSLPTSNASFDGGVDVPAPNYFGAGFGGNAPTANRFSNDAGLEVGALSLPSTATKN